MRHVTLCRLAEAVAEAQVESDRARACVICPCVNRSEERSERRASTRRPNDSTPRSVRAPIRHLGSAGPSGQCTGETNNREFFQAVYFTAHTLYRYDCTLLVLCAYTTATRSPETPLLEARMVSAVVCAAFSSPVGFRWLRSSGRRGANQQCHPARYRDRLGRRRAARCAGQARSARDRSHAGGVTNAAGVYVFNFLPAGEYVVTAELAGSRCVRQARHQAARSARAWRSI